MWKQVRLGAQGSLKSEMELEDHYRMKITSKTFAIPILIAIYHINPSEAVRIGITML